MTAAAAASSSGFRFRQSFSRARQELLGLVARQSFVLQGDRHGVSGRSLAATACTTAVCSLGSPASRRGRPMTITPSPSASRASASTSRASSRDLLLESPVDAIVFHGARQHAGRIATAQARSASGRSRRPAPASNRAYHAGRRTRHRHAGGTGRRCCGHEIIEPSHEVPRDAGYGHSRWLSSLPLRCRSGTDRRRRAATGRRW